jgi:glycosyltransferase involved in cell wall biosynthesis
LDPTGLPARVRATGYIPDEDLPGLYCGALCLALPSLDEGAGLPALEAAACGLPVMASRAGALPEMLGDAALYIDPYNAADLADRLVELGSDPALRRDLAARGLERTGSLDWESPAASVQAALQEVGGR